MLLTCPSCGARHAIEAATNDEAARELVKVVAALDDAAVPTLHYLALHRPPRRALRWIRALALMRELSEAFHAGAVARNGRQHPIRPEAWRPALEAVIAAGDEGRLRRPLKGHGYFWEVLVGHSEKLAGEAERAHDEALRGRRRPAGEEDEEPADEPVALTAAEVRKHLDRTWEAIGRTPPERPA